jgi:hypothetical protein
MSALVRWLASTNPADNTGEATFSAGGCTVYVRLQAFEEAQALGNLIQAAQDAGRRGAAASAACYLRGLANELEEGSK